MNSLAYVDLVSENVLRPARAVTAAPSLSFNFDPAGVRLDQAVGGFNSVAEFSTGLCLRIFDSSLALDRLSLGSTTDFINILNLETDPFDSPLLNQLKSQGTTGTSVLAPEVLVTDFQPVSLEFQDPHRVLVRYRANLVLGGDLPRPPIEYPWPPIFDPTIYQDIYETIYENMAMRSRAANALRTFSAPCAGRSAAYKTMSARGTFPLPGPQSGISSGGLLGSAALAGAYGNLLAVLNFEIACNYSFSKDDNLKRVKIFADLSSATCKVTGDNDVLRLYNRSLFGADGAYLKDYVLKESQASLAPEISLVGITGSYTPVTELPNFDPVVFHLADASKKQALAAGFNLKPGCDGVIEHVQRFIGDSEYGVISDGYLVERMFKYKWRMNGFFRQFPLSQPIKVQRNSHEENANLCGYLSLDTLDVASIEIDANSGSDIVKLSGAGSVHTEYIQFADGTRTYQPDADHVNFGDPKATNWIFASALDIDSVLSTEPLIRQFQIKAYNDAFQYIARPFSKHQQVQIDYVRLEAATNQVYMIGSFTDFTI